MDIKERTRERLQELNTKWSYLASQNPAYSRSFIDGGRAFEDGVAVTECPYNEDLHSMLEWNSGWLMARRAYVSIAIFHQTCEAAGVLRST